MKYIVQHASAIWYTCKRKRERHSATDKRSERTRDFKLSEPKILHHAANCFRNVAEFPYVKISCRTTGSRKNIANKTIHLHKKIH